MLNDVAFPTGPQQPVIATPVGNELRCFAIALYGSHASGADLDDPERGLIAKLAATAAVAYAQMEIELLRERIAMLERGLSPNSQSAARTG